MVVAAFVAAATAFVTSCVRVLVRLTQQDISSRMFATATRAVAVATTASAGLSLVLADLVNANVRAIVLGILCGVMGEHAILPLVEKAGKLFTIKTREAAPPSPLLAIEGLTEEHVARLEEEDIRSVHDLAFVPTARLFFPTPYSLQQIANWQDRALLRVYVSPEGVKGLDNKMKILGAIDLRGCVHQLRFSSKSEVYKMAQRETLKSALNLDEGGLEALIDSMIHDEVTLRVRLLWQASVGTEDPAEPEWVKPEATADEPRRAAVSAIVERQVLIPYARFVAGEIGAASFSTESLEFTLVFDADPNIGLPTEIYVPLTYYPDGYLVDAPGCDVNLVLVRGGTIVQVLPRSEGVATVTIRPRASSARRAATA
jgi:hypothetical protein